MKRHIVLLLVVLAAVAPAETHTRQSESGRIIRAALVQSGKTIIGEPSRTCVRPAFFQRAPKLSRAEWHYLFGEYLASSNQVPADLNQTLSDGFVEAVAQPEKYVRANWVPRPFRFGDHKDCQEWLSFSVPAITGDVAYVQISRVADGGGSGRFLALRLESGRWMPLAQIIYVVA